MTALLVAGTSSHAGKSLLATALCASLRRRGLRVAPFKAQNMSNNARVATGGEIGTAQYLQALAAGVEPHVDHNPVLLKPEADTRSQVVLLGQVDRALTETPWRSRTAALRAVVTAAYDRIAAGAQVVVIEGAGSPAEINLAGTDLANLGIGRHADATTVLVCDIDRGGAFAHLYGTWALLEPQDRRRVKGFVLNRFRGDPALLEPGPAMLQQLTGVRTIGTVPMVEHDLPDEDGADPRPTSAGPRRVRVVRGPAASNLDEWWALRATSSFAWATAPADLDGADLIVLPGSKLVAADLDWLRRTGLDAAVAAAYERGTPILAVCGGIQVLGGRLDDPDGVERPAHGLGLVPVATTLAARKTVRRTRVRFTDRLPHPWQALRGLAVDGYEIHYGRSTLPGTALHGADAPLGFVHGPVLGVYVHGLAEQPDVVQALTGQRPRRTLADTFADLADLVEEHVDVDALLPR